MTGKEHGNGWLWPLQARPYITLHHTLAVMSNDDNGKIDSDMRTSTHHPVDSDMRTSTHHPVDSDMRMSTHHPVLPGMLPLDLGHSSPFLVDVWYKCSSGVSMSMCYVVLRWMMFGVVIG